MNRGRASGGFVEWVRRCVGRGALGKGGAAELFLPNSSSAGQLVLVSPECVYPRFLPICLFLSHPAGEEGKPCVRFQQRLEVAHEFRRGATYTGSLCDLPFAVRISWLGAPS